MPMKRDWSQEEIEGWLKQTPLQFLESFRHEMLVYTSNITLTVHVATTYNQEGRSLLEDLDLQTQDAFMNIKDNAHALKQLSDLIGMYLENQKKLS